MASQSVASTYPAVKFLLRRSPSITGRCRMSSVVTLTTVPLLGEYAIVLEEETSKVPRVQRRMIAFLPKEEAHYEGQTCAGASKVRVAWSFRLHLIHDAPQATFHQTSPWYKHMPDACRNV